MTAAPPTRHTPRFDAGWLVEVLALATLYFLTARLGLLMAIPGMQVTPVWPPSGIALAALLLRGRRVWPGIWLGSFAANLWDFYGSPVSLATELATSATFGIGASLSALLGRQLLRWFVGERNPLERVRDVCAFMALGGVVSYLVSATVGVTTLCLAGFAPWSSYGQAWLTWWLGDTAGVFIVAPLLLVWGGTHQRTSAARWVELLGGLGLLIAVTYYVFIESTTVLFTGKSLAFILIPFLVWSAVRFERRGAATAAGLIALLAVWGTIHGSGPFNLGSRNESLLALELFLSVVSLTALCIAAVVTARRDAESDRRRVLAELESRVAERTASLDQANAALRESEARTRLLIKSANIGLWDWNLVTNEVYFSHEWKSQLGYAEGEIPERFEEWETRLHPDDRELFFAKVRELVASGGRNYEAEYGLRHKDGTYRWIFSRAELFAGEDGKPARMVGAHLDITERKRTEAATVQLAAIVRFSDDAIIGKDLNGIITSWNRGAERIFGYAAGEIVGSPITRLIPPDRQGEKEQVLTRIRQGESVEHFETVRIGKDGRQIDVSLTVSPIKDAIGDVVGASVVARDITERKTNEKALESAEEKYRSIFNSALDGIFRTSPDGKLLVANPAAARIFGFASPEELIEGRWDVAQQSYADPRRREEFKRLIQEQGVVNGFEFEAYRKDGSRVWISENTHAVHSPSGELLYFEGIFEDVTDRKRTEEALNAQALRYKTLTETSTDSIYVLDAKGNLQEANAAFLRQRGYTAAEVKGLSVADWDAQWSREQLQEKLRKLVGSSAVFETRHRCKDGSVFDVEVCATSVRIGGEQLFFCVTRDITERKRAAKELEGANDQLRFLSRRLFQVQEDEKRHMARELHDEMGQALTAVKINLQSAQRVDNRADLGLRLDESIGILDGLLRQTRRLSLDLRPPLLDDLGLVPALRSYLDEQAQRAGFRATFFADPRLERVSTEIETACFRVAQQALTNAMRHAQARNVNVELHLAPHALHLIVADDGAGFDVKAAEERARRGGSLGLPGMRERLSLVGGELDCKSTPGRGTEVHAFVPLQIDANGSGLLP